MSMKIFDKEKLISLVRAKRAIWDKSHPHHFNKGILHKHWQAVSAELQIPENIIKRQWKYLRQEFGRQLKRAASAAIIAPEEDDITSWPHYYSMLFVIDQFSTRDDLASPTTPPHLQEMVTPKIEVDSDESDKEQDKTEGCAPESDHSSIVSEPIPKPKATTNNQSTNTTERALKTLPVDRKDDDVAFFDSILPHVMSLKTEQKFQFRMQIQKILYDMLFPPPNSEHVPSKPSDSGYLARIVPINSDTINPN